MADKRITQLAAIDAADAQGDVDVLALADVSAVETKKITITDAVVAGLTGNVPDGTIPGSKIADNSITEDQLAANSVSSSELQNLSVDTQHIQAEAVTNAKLAGGITNAKLANNSVGTNQLIDLSVTSEKLAGGITNDQLAGGITQDKLAQGSVGSDQIKNNSVNGGVDIQNRTITANKIVQNALTATEIASGAIGTTELAASAVTQAKLDSECVGTEQLIDAAVVARTIAAGSVYEAKLADNSVSSAKIQVDAVANSHLQTGIDGAKLLNNSVDNSKLSGEIDGGRLTAGSVSDSALAFGIDGAKLVNDSVGSDKLGNNIDGTKLATGSVANTAISSKSITADEIAENTITGTEIAAQAVDTPQLANGAVTGQKIEAGAVTTEKLASNINGSKLADESVSASKLAGGIGSDLLADVDLDKLPAAPAGTVVAGPVAGECAAPSYRQIAPTDLPAATTEAKGAVVVPDGSGIAVNGTGDIQVDNAVAVPDAGGYPFVTFEQHGLITGGRTLLPEDLPPANGSTLGGVKAGDGITINPDGTINQSDTGVAAGQYTKVTVDKMGSVVSATQLEGPDIPNIEWDQINNPLVDNAVLGNQSVGMRNLRDYSTSFIQEAEPTLGPEVPIGAFWFQESSASLYQYNGNSWMSVGIGRLSAENLRFCGVFNASTGIITGLTQFGTAENYEIGTAIPQASDEQTGVYFICEVAGSGVNVTPAVTYDAGDWLLCQGAATGWTRIDTTSSGGGSGGVNKLSELLDVAVSGAVSGSLLQLQGDGQWKNITTIDSGTY